jgi:very-short-patch-repair endonuclease
MSLNRLKELRDVAKAVCRDLRKRSTKAEKILWEYVRSGKFENKKFYRQYPIFYDFEGKESFFIADFFCYTENLIIELDGEIHKYRLKEDAERTDILNLLGMRVLRFTNDEIKYNIENVLKIIKAEFDKNSSPAPFSF